MARTAPLEPTQAAKPDFRELGISGTRLFAGILAEETVPQLTGMNAYRSWNGMRFDATASALYKAIELPLRSCRWFVNPASDHPDAMSMADFCHDNLWEFGQQSMDDVLRLALQCLPFGFSWMEVLYDYIDQGPWAGKVGWTELAWRSQASQWRWNMDYQNGRRQLVSVTQLSPPFYQQVEIPRSKLLIFTNDKEGDNYAGYELDIDTPIPTPDGWSTMGALRSGDRVYDERGAPCRVLAKSEVHRNKPCYEVEFNSGERVVTSGDHHWVARSYQDRKHHKPGRVITTEEMVASLKYRRTVGQRGRIAAGAEPARDGKETNNWSVQAATQLQGDPIPLPFEPYVLGYWLGDGTSTKTEIAYDEQDREELTAHFAAAGFDLYPPPRSAARKLYFRPTGVPRYAHHGTKGALAEARVLGSKHVPLVYFRAAPSQRLALLQGLMDADGTVVKANGLCQFANADRGLVDAVAELASTLGCCWMHLHSCPPSKIHDYKGQVIVGRQEMWYLTFSLPLPAFRLSRKLCRQNLKPERARRDHYVIGIRPVESRPVQCITVDSPSHLYLVGRRMIPTHNSLFRPGWKSYFIRDRLYRIQAIGLERAFMGIPVASLPEGYSDELRDLARSIVESIRVDEQAGVIKPVELVLEVLRGELQGPAMQQAIAHHNRQILLSQLAQFLDLGSGQSSGAYALSSDHSELFLNAIAAKGNYIAQVLNQEPGIPSLIRFNFPNVDRLQLPRLQHGDIGQKSLDRLGRALQALGQWGFLTPDDPTEDRLRQMLDLPERETSITDRALFDLIQETFPHEQQWGRQQTGGRLPSPLETKAIQAQAPSTAPASSPSATPGKGKGPAVDAGTVPKGKGTANQRAAAQMDSAERLYRNTELVSRITETVARKRWDRPAGRLTDQQRMRVAVTEEFAESLEDFHRAAGRIEKPERPSLRMARCRRPYTVSNQPTPAVPRAGAAVVAGRHRIRMAEVLAGGPR